MIIHYRKHTRNKNKEDQPKNNIENDSYQIFQSSIMKVPPKYFLYRRVRKENLCCGFPLVEIPLKNFSDVAQNKKSQTISNIY